MTFDVVQTYADMVRCRPVDLGNSLCRRLRELEAKIRADARQEVAAILKDDAYAMSFQSLGQYRKALLSATASASGTPSK